MNKGLILWDIDGTLLKRASRESKSIHLEALYGDTNYSVDSTELTGLTDWEVLNHYEKNIEHVRVAFSNLDVMQENQKFDEFVPIKGINAQLFREINENWTNGILTGNSMRRAKFKLKAVDLLHNFDERYIFVCQEGETRPNILSRALKQLKGNFDTIIIIGDTINDIKTAKLFELPVVSVATGKFKLNVLSNYNPDISISNFLDDRIEFQNFLISIAM